MLTATELSQGAGWPNRTGLCRFLAESVPVLAVLDQLSSLICRQHQAALAIQCAYRRHRAQAAYQKSLRSVILAQNAWRARVARRKLRCVLLSMPAVQLRRGDLLLSRSPDVVDT